MKLSIKDNTGKDTGKTIELADAVFGVEPSDHAIYLDVKQHLANVRQGTHKSKERNEISGSTRKLKRQKGTGGARAGDINSPLMRGGARVFGPKPRDYHFKLNRKVKQLARRSALSYKASNSAIVVLQDFEMAKPKTKEFLGLLKNLGLSENKTLVILSEANRNLFLSARNLQGSRVTAANRLNTYDIMNANTVVMLESSVNMLNQTLS
jgi:large subunit ribosomal protein L4